VTRTPITLPSNVARFEQLMYLSLGIGLIESALQWSQNVTQANAFGGAGFVLFVQAFVVVFMVLFIWLVARRHKNWARWLLLVIFILGLPIYVKTLGPMLPFNPVAGILSVLQLLCQLVALVLIFTGNARGWFEQSSQLRN
jgi:hypothetical protein